MMCGANSGSSASSLPICLISLLRLVDVGVVGDADRQFVDHPVAAHVLHRAELAERHGEERPAVVAQLHRAQAEDFDRALVAAALDVFADAERVVEQIEDAADDVLDQRLRAEADGDADDARAGDQRADLDAERRRAPSVTATTAMHEEQDVAEDRQQACASAPVGSPLSVPASAGTPLSAELAVDARLDHLPDEIGEKNDHDAHKAPRNRRVRRVSRPVSSIMSTCQTWPSHIAASTIRRVRKPRSRQTSSTPRRMSEMSEPSAGRRR